MKLLYTLITCLTFSTIFAQNKYNLSLGADFVIDYRQDKIHTGGLVKFENNTATITSGKITGNFQGKPNAVNREAINGNKYWYKPAMIGTKNKLSFHCAEQEFCFLTNPIDISASDKIGFKVDYSGKGSLDVRNPSDGKIWHDWIDFNYYIDGKIVNGKESERLDGFGYYYIDGQKGTKYQKQNIDVRNGKDFQIEICLRNTGHDEWYTIENIEITESKFIEIDMEAIEVIAPKIKPSMEVISCFTNIHNASPSKDTDSQDEETETTVPKKKVTNSPTLVVYPNPTNNILELIDAHKYDLTSIQIFDVTGKLINNTNTYPLNVVALSAGTYILSVVEIDTAQRVNASFVVVAD